MNKTNEMNKKIDRIGNIIFIVFMLIFAVVIIGSVVYSRIIFDVFLLVIYVISLVGLCFGAFYKAKTSRGKKALELCFKGSLILMATMSTLMICVNVGNDFGLIAEIIIGILGYLLLTKFIYKHIINSINN